jgi:hypothetical protein
MRHWNRAVSPLAGGQEGAGGAVGSGGSVGSGIGEGGMA